MSMYVVSHKDVDLVLPKDYRIIAVGNDKDKVMNKHFSDDTGENIANKNSSYCELTALYWLWKNSQDKEIGLCHYRRLFMFEELDNNDIVPFFELSELLKKYDIVLPPIYHNNKTVYEHYASDHIKADMDSVGKIIATMYPNYSESFSHIMNGNNEYGFNIFASNRELMNKYCSWVFDILQQLESTTDITGYDNYQKRIFGFLSERLFTTWIYHQKLSIKELPIKNPEHSEEKIYQKKLRKLARPKYAL
ncbi:MAG: DUF4422 domain-containing protein [Mollicutes bacterium]|nr:DUF4422 domain-containing protein [Mollicutes bacterium]